MDISNKERQTLHSNRKDKTQSTVSGDDNILHSRGKKTEDVHELAEFLDFMANDIAQNPQNTQPLTAQMQAEGDELVKGAEFDMNNPLLDERE